MEDAAADRAPVVSAGADVIDGGDLLGEDTSSLFGQGLAVRGGAIPVRSPPRTRRLEPRKPFNIIGAKYHVALAALARKITVHSGHVVCF